MEAGRGIVSTRWVFRASFTDEQIERIESAARRAGRSVSDELRRRVEASFASEDVGDESMSLLQAVMRLALLVEVQTGKH